MLVSEVVNSKSIALSVTEDLRGDDEYLGVQFFPEDKKAGLDLKWVKTHKGLPVSLAPSNFDALPVLRGRDNLDINRSQMAFFREEMDIREEDVYEIDRVKDADDPYLDTALRSIYDDADALIRGAKVVGERMRMQLLATTNGSPVIVIEANGVQYAYNYDPDGSYAANNYRNITTSTQMWNDATNSTPISDLIAAKRELSKKGRKAAFVIMNPVTFEYLINSKQVKDSILAQNVTATITVDDSTVKEFIKQRTGLTILVHDKMFIDGGVEQYFYPDNKVTLVPNMKLGKTWYGDTPEMLTARQYENTDLTVYGKGISIATSIKYGPPAKYQTIASLVALPSYENMDGTYVINVVNP